MFNIPCMHVSHVRTYADIRTNKNNLDLEKMSFKSQIGKNEFHQFDKTIFLYEKFGNPEVSSLLNNK
jgi:hypothetical protein